MDDSETLIPEAPASASSADLRHLLDTAPLGAVQLAQPPLDASPYREFVHALLGKQGFKLDFNRLSPGEALALVADKLLGPGAFADQRAALAQDIAALADRAASMVNGRASIAIRTYFAPGDLVWHVDRVSEPDALRVLWPLARPAGMRLTAASNIDDVAYRAFMRREFPQLTRMDTRVMRTNVPVEKLWAHRPRQLEAMRTGRFPFLRDPQAIAAIEPGAISIHRVETPGRQGAFHRSSWENRHSPGLQIVITALASA